MLQQHGAGHHLPLVAHEILQQLVLTRLQADQLALTPYLLAEQVHLQVSNLKTCCHFATQLPRVSRQDFQARQQFRHGKRLYEIIVGATVQALHPVVDAAQSAQEQHRRALPLLAQQAQQGQSVQPRQHAVDHQHIVLAATRSR